MLLFHIVWRKEELVETLVTALHNIWDEDLFFFSDCIISLPFKLVAFLFPSRYWPLLAMDWQALCCTHLVHSFFRSISFWSSLSRIHCFMSELWLAELTRNSASEAIFWTAHCYISYGSFVSDEWSHIVQSLYSHIWYVGCGCSHLYLPPGGTLMIWHFVRVYKNWKLIPSIHTDSKPD